MANPLLEDVVSGLQHSIDTTFGEDPDTLSTRQVDTKDGSVLDLNPGGGVRTSPEVFVDFSEVDDGTTTTYTNDGSNTNALQVSGNSASLIAGTDSSIDRAYMTALDSGGGNAAVRFTGQVETNSLGNFDGNTLNITAENDITLTHGSGSGVTVDGDSGTGVLNTSTVNASTANHDTIFPNSASFLTLNPQSGQSGDLAIKSRDTVAGPTANYDQGDVFLQCDTGILHLRHKDGQSLTVNDVDNNGNGIINADTKNFSLRDEANDRTIRHAVVESNLGTQCLYRFNVTTKKGVAKVDLPDYFSWLTFDDANVFCQAEKHFGMAYGEITRKNASVPVEGASGGELTIKSNQDGPYSVMVVVSRDNVYTDIIKQEGDVKPKQRKSHELGKRKMEE